MLQSAVALALYSCEVHIDINSIPTGDEAITTLIVEPFYSSLHCS